MSESEVVKATIYEIVLRRSEYPDNTHFAVDQSNYLTRFYTEASIQARFRCIHVGQTRIVIKRDNVIIHSISISNIHL